MLNRKLDKLDSAFYSTIHITNFKTTLFKGITFLASAKFIAVLCILLLIFVEDKMIPIIIIINMLIMWGLIGILKRTFKRQRPNINRLTEEKGYSYPSGHTMTATIFYGFIIFLIILINFVMPIKILFILALIILILLVAYTRIYLGVHYLSDVIGAILIGSSYTLLYIFFTYFILNLL